MKEEIKEIQFYRSIGLGIKVTQEGTRYIFYTLQSNHIRVQSILVTITLILISQVKSHLDTRLLQLVIFFLDS